ncbi:glycosyltransferase family 2 protein, partial [candidate division KSB1 bacterium]|nr:glycosyltransferase family 2 protein [candidate division KSB1 bacterium]
DLLQVVIINDGSTDGTDSLIAAMAQKDARIKPVNLPPAESGHGKAFALNLGLEHCDHEFIAVYDADNNPEPDSLRTLVPYLMEDEKTAAVIGKFRTINKNTGWLTRFINIETIAFQWILQAGRYQLLRVSILPGTNYVIRKSVVQACGGWDNRAITEDSEISMRIYQAGYTIRFMPLAVTWEQEPETLAVWIRQRMRWVRGNNYVMRKFFRQMLKSRFLFTEFVYLFALYYLFLLATVLSLILFVLGGMGLITLNVPGPYFGVWVTAFILFVFEVLIALSYEEEDHPRNILYTVLMYFTYCQLWLFVVFKALIRDLRGYRVGVWDKTDRFEVALESTEEKQS